MRKLALRVGFLAATCVAAVALPMSFTPAPAQAQGLYVQIGPGPGFFGGGYYGPPPGYYYRYRRDRFCRAAFWRHDWRAMRWCRWHGY